MKGEGPGGAVPIKNDTEPEKVSWRAVRVARWGSQPVS